MADARNFEVMKVDMRSDSDDTEDESSYTAQTAEEKSLQPRTPPTPPPSPLPPALQERQHVFDLDRQNQLQTWLRPGNNNVNFQGGPTGTSQTFEPRRQYYRELPPNSENDGVENAGNKEETVNISGQHTRDINGNIVRVLNNGIQDNARRRENAEIDISEVQKPEIQNSPNETHHENYVAVLTVVPVENNAETPDDAPDGSLTTVPIADINEDAPAGRLNSVPVADNNEDAPEGRMNTVPVADINEDAPAGRLSSVPVADINEDAPEGRLTTKPVANINEDTPERRLTTVPVANINEDAPDGSLNTVPVADNNEDAPAGSLNSVPVADINEAAPQRRLKRNNEYVPQGRLNDVAYSESMSDGLGALDANVSDNDISNIAIVNSILLNQSSLNNAFEYLLPQSPPNSVDLHPTASDIDPAHVAMVYRITTLHKSSLHNAFKCLLKNAQRRGNLLEAAAAKTYQAWKNVTQYNYGLVPALLNKVLENPGGLSTFLKLMVYKVQSLLALIEGNKDGLLDAMTKAIALLTSPFQPGIATQVAWIYLHYGLACSEDCQKQVWLTRAQTLFRQDSNDDADDGSTDDIEARCGADIVGHGLDESYQSTIPLYYEHQFYQFYKKLVQQPIIALAIDLKSCLKCIDRR